MEQQLTKRCKTCGEVLPIDMFYIHTRQNGKSYYRSQCRKCFNDSDTHRRAKRDIKGNILKKCELSVSEDEMTSRLYDDGKVLEFDIDDLLEEVKINGKAAIKSLHNTFVLHKDLLNDVENRIKIDRVVLELVETLRQIAEVKEDEGI